MILKSLSDNVVVIGVRAKVSVSYRVRASAKDVYREGHEAIRIK